VRTTLPFILIVVLAFASAPANAQPSAKIPQIGYLNTRAIPSPNFPPELAVKPMFVPFQQGLRELGYIEGQNIIVHRRLGEGQQLWDFATEFVRLKVDAIVAYNTEPIRAAMSATRTIPIVMTHRGDPILLGFVASLERPGGNVTGISGLALELGGKWLELMKEAIPSAKRVAVFWNRTAEERIPIWKSLDVTARSLRVNLDWLELRNDRDIVTKFRMAIWNKADALIVLPSAVSSRNIQTIGELARKYRLPGMFWQTDFAQDEFGGGLMAYGANRLEQSRRAAYVVDKILKGAKPAELPVEPPKSFELVINLKTAKEIGITIPLRMLAWADRVIKQS
jgi:putative ABC transport system substrate-binding protein